MLECPVSLIVLVIVVLLMLSGPLARRVMSSYFLELLVLCSVL